MRDHEAVLAVIDAYCTGVYRGDVDLLRSVFHPKAVLFAEVRGAPSCKRLEEYLAIVANRQSPQALGEAYRMKPIAVEVTHEIAFAKVHCPMLGYDYTDYLSFVREAGRWRIVSKVFTDVPHQEN
ncbi:nuclear transport factor 2 family protein [Noviherbaspirillum sp. ST9]|uniref:nuclear transport factor 2 family protein n=1 Tax=Noviherbaspirillum sp. ST9 TaxID=3401606 RepID=UPI003B586CC2